MSETNTAPETKAADREDLLLSAMADQNREFESFRENVSERLARVERDRRRSSILDLDAEKLIDLVVFAGLALLALRLGIFLMAYLRNKEERRGYLSMPQA